MRFAQILRKKAHWIFEADEKPNFPPGPEGEPIIIVDITGKPEVKEGWGYNAETGEFTEPPEPEPLPPEQDIVSLIQPMTIEDTTTLQNEVHALREQMSTLINLIQQKDA